MAKLRLKVVNSTKAKKAPAVEVKEKHHHYLVYGQHLCSNRILPELQPSRFQVRDILFRLECSSTMGGEIPQTANLLVRRLTNLSCYLSVYKNEEGFLMRWEGLCSFQISDDGRSITCYPGHGTAPAWINSTLYGMVLAFALHLKGVGNLHASAVVLPGGAVGFLADPGSGKSTLAAGFVAAGFPFLTDDVLTITEQDGGIRAFPGFPFVSLSKPSMRRVAGVSPPTSLAMSSEKARVSVDGNWGSFHAQPTPLRCLYRLTRGNGVRKITITPLPAPVAMQGLLSDTNCLPILTKDVLSRHLAFLGRLIAGVTVWRLSYPTGYKHIALVLEVVLEHQGTLAAKGHPE